MARTASLETYAKRFADKVHIVPFSTCHYWGGHINGHGYGMFKFRGRVERAHRVNYVLTKGEIPEINGKPAVLRHKCDQPLCVNPDHLVPGTQLENIQDAVDRERMPRGEDHHHCTVSDSRLAEIMSDIAAGGATGVLAERYGVSPSYISTLRHGGGRAKGLEKPKGRSDRRLSDEAALSIYEMAWKGVNSRDLIAKLHGTTKQSVSDIKRGATYAGVTGHGRA